MNVSSGAAMKGEVTRTAYSASKAGSEWLTRSIATQYSRAGIRANIIVIDGGMSAHVGTRADS